MNLSAEEAINRGTRISSTCRVGGRTIAKVTEIVPQKVINLL